LIALFVIPEEKMKKSDSISKSVVRNVVLITALLSMLLQPMMVPVEAGYDPAYGWYFFSDVESMMPAPHYFDLALDEGGNPHLAYFKDGINEDYLVYKYFDGTGWQTFPMDVVGELDFVSLELGENGQPHIAYHDGVSKMTTYANFDGSDWLTSPVTPSQQLSGMFTDLALTSGGVPKIAFFSETASSLLLATFVDDQFTYETVDSGVYFNFISLATDEADQPGIAYCEGTTAGNCSKLKYAEYRELSWQVETLEEADFLDQTGNFASLAIDSIGDPHISYVSKESSIVNVKYASISDHGWQIETIESWRSGVLGLYSRIALDGDDSPSIAYYDPLAQSPDYQWWDGSAWNTNMDLDQTQMGTYMNLALKSPGNPTLAFWDTAGSTIALAEYAPGPDLAVSNFWVNEADSLLTASIRNDGQGTYYDGEIHIGLYVDGTLTQELWPFSVIEPGEVFLVDLVEPVCTTATPTMEVKVCLLGDVDYNMANNCLVETLPCDLSPLIISDFTISDVSMSGFNASWTTNRPADTNLRYTDGTSEQAYTNGDKVTSHLAVISGLSPHQVYYAQAFSIDGAGLFVKGARTTVKTLASPGLPIPNPTHDYQRLDTRYELYDLEAVYPDPSNIEQVRFYLDDVLVGTDATPDGGRYSIQFSPGRMGYARTEFFDLSHRLRTEAIPFNPAIDPDVQESLLEFQRESSPVEAYFINPEIDSTLVVPGVAVPSGMIREVKVLAQAFEWECEYGGIGNQPNCEDVAHHVDGVKFYIDNQLHWTDMSTDDFYYSFMWDMSGLPVGTHSIKAEVMDADGSVEEITASLNIEQGQAYVTANRVVSRDGNLFHVDVEVKNQDISNADVVFSQLTDYFKGFQPINQEFQNYTLDIGSDPNGKITSATLIMDPPQTLEPGETLTLSYDLIPVLFTDMNTAVYKIGVPESKLTYKILGFQRERLFTLDSQVWDPTSASYVTAVSAASKAFRDSDYVMITSPDRMFSLYVGDDVINLLGDMALLASLKNGVLAYWDPAFGKEDLNELLHDNSSWTDRLHPNFETRYHGYVLIVGETEIIPSDTTGPFELEWSGEDADNYYVRISDNTYAHTDGNGAPDLLLGRIIGNTAEELDIAIWQSIDTHLENSYERAQAYVGSGTGDGESRFQSNADSITNTLTDFGYTVSKHHWEFEAFLGNYAGFEFAAHDGLAHADLDGDQIDELIWARDDHNAVYRISGLTGELTRAFTLDFEDGDSLAAGDVDNDAQVEIIIGDRNDTIRAYDLSGVQKWSFSQDFAAWEQIAVGDVLYSHPGNEIVMADDNDLLHIFGYDSSNTNLALLRTIDFGQMGFNFADFDILQIGNITEDNNVGLEEILFSDRTHDKIIGITGNGIIKRELVIDVDYGDNFEVADVSGTGLDEIIFADRDNNIRTYDGISGIDHTHYTHADFEEYDGLLARDKPGYDDIFLFDRGDVLRHVDMNYPDYAISLFEGNLSGVDYISFSGHGNADGISPAINVDNFPVSFAEAHPIVAAWSCLTGYYEGNGDNGIAEAFLQSGAGIYFGSTEVSPGTPNSNMSRLLLEDYWTPGQTFADSVARFKNNRWNISEYYDWWWYVINEYNLYGDPKFDVFHDTTTLETIPSSGAVDTRAGLVIDLPMYEVENIDGIDYVEIPGGQLFTDQGQFQVPIFSYNVEYPGGIQVNDVILTHRDNMIAENGLNLPIIEMVQDGDSLLNVRSALTEQTLSSIPGNDWSPNFESPFEWRVYDNGEDGSTLTLVLYPFYYDPAAQYSEYYQHFEFAVETVSTDLTIDEAVVDKSQYSPGEDVNLNLSLANTGVPLDTVVSAVITKGGSGEQVGGFPLTGLTNLEGKTVLELAWNWLDDAVVPAGDYTIEIIIEDMEGNRLAQRSLGLRLGETAGEITTFEVSPNTFNPGEIIDVDMVFRNSGDLPISGEAIIQVQTKAGVIVGEFQAPINDLVAGESLPVAFAWDSTGVSENEYWLVGFVKYNSQTTPTASVILTVSNNLQNDVFLPLILR
jgi:hypothetical protein